MIYGHIPPPTTYELRDEIATLRAQLAAAESRAEQSNVLTDDMLRYAMAALGTNCPADADLYRAFWFHAITMRQSQRKLSKGDEG